MQPEAVRDKRLAIIWAVLAAVWAVELALALLALRRGIPDYYPRQHASRALASAGGLLVALGTLVRGRRPRWALLGAGLVTLLVSLGSDLSP
jgi:hypothetical protein